MKNNDIDIAKLIKRKRLEKGLTLETVAKNVGVAKSTVSKWERGAIQNMKKDKLDALSLILDIDPLVFIYGSEEILNNTKETEEVTRKDFDNEVTSLLSKTNSVITRKDFANIVTSLLSKTNDINEQEKALLIQTLNLICSDKK